MTQPKTTGRHSARPKPDREWNTPPYYAALIGGRPETLIAEIRAGRLKAADFARKGAKRPRYRIHQDDFQAWLDRRAVAPAAPATARRRRPESAVTKYV